MPDWNTIRRKFRLPERVFLVLLVLWLAVTLTGVGGGASLILGLVTFAAAIVVAVRLLRSGIRAMIWRLRNRLLVAYGFIALVPVVLIVSLAYFGLSTVASRIAVSTAREEYNHQIEALQGLAVALAKGDPTRRAEIATRAGAYFNERFPGFELYCTVGQDSVQYPADRVLRHPPRGWGDVSGLLVKSGQLYAWSHVLLNETEVTALAPLNADFFQNLAPRLGGTRLTPYSESTEQTTAALRRQRRTFAQQDRRNSQNPVGRWAWLDQISDGTLVPVAIWDAPGSTETANLGVRTTISAVLGLFFGTRLGAGGEVEGQLGILYALGVLFLIFEIAAMAVGVSLTRTITGAVHHLYVGTQRVMQGDFSNRIPVQGHDQLAELSRSFNRMTENLERLVVVAKEKERLTAEIEIAREVQNQLFPKSIPETRTLRLLAHCTPARMVSGDYYDYQALEQEMVALAMGDVAGKGISAALLMATLQSSLRTQLRGCLERAAEARSSNGCTSPLAVSPAALVSQLNQQLYSFTSPEKYATFFFGVYDDTTGDFHYSNAGHLPPILVRDGEASRLDINGMVVGAFEFAQYESSCLRLNPGDLLLFYTDGITEPENEYGEMFGEDRLIDTVMRSIDRGEDEIIANVVESVRRWTGSPELQDDMTLMLARRV